MDYNFFHKGKCGGRMVLDVTGIFALKSPSFSFFREGVKIGAVEFVLRTSEASCLKMYCEKCRESVSMEDMEKMVTCKCSTCDVAHSPSETYCTSVLGNVCEGCVDELSGKGKTTNPKLTSFLDFYKLDRKENYPTVLQALSKMVFF